MKRINAFAAFILALLIFSCSNGDSPVYPELPESDPSSVPEFEGTPPQGSIDEFIISGFRSAFELGLFDPITDIPVAGLSSTVNKSVTTATNETEDGTETSVTYTDEIVYDDLDEPDGILNGTKYSLINNQLDHNDDYSELHISVTLQVDIDMEFTLDDFDIDEDGNGSPEYSLSGYAENVQSTLVTNSMESNEDTETFLLTATGETMTIMGLSISDGTHGCKIVLMYSIIQDYTMDNPRDESAMEAAAFANAVLRIEAFDNDNNSIYTRTYYGPRVLEWQPGYEDDPEYLLNNFMRLQSVR